jgi:Rieske 2Fe-2S family protein
MSAFERTADSYHQGAKTMPGEYYTSPAILAEERERIFAKQWNCVGRANAIANPGEYIVREIAGESIIVLRGRDGRLRAFFNVCRHRGTRLCVEASGRVSETIQCPYHAWTYATDGRLIGAPHMNEVEGFDKSRYSLHAAAIEELAGFVFVNIDRDPPPFAPLFAPMADRFARLGLGPLVVRHRVTYDVRANWKLVFQNYSECLHCPVIHPELGAVIPYLSGENDLTDGPFIGGFMEIAPPNASATMSGRACARPLNSAMAPEDRQRAYFYSVMPNLMVTVQPDFVNYYILTPVAVDRTTVESEWLFSADNDGDPAFNPQDAIAMWEITNRQDWDISARSQLGIASRRYQPGPYSPREAMPAAWDREYLRQMARGAGHTGHTGHTG